MSRGCVLDPPVPRRRFRMARRSRGFTLIELMVALVIIGILASMVTLAISGDRRIEMTTDQVRRLEALMELALEEAIYEGRHLGLVFTRTGYGFRVYEGQLWVPLDEDGLLRERDWPEELNVQLELEDKRVVLPKGFPKKPQVFILASGEMTAFRLTVEFGRDQDTQAVLSGNIIGRLSTQLPGEEPEEVPDEEDLGTLSVPALEGKDSSTRR